MLKNPQNALALVQNNVEHSPYGNPAIDAKMEAIRELNDFLDHCILSNPVAVEENVKAFLNDPKTTRRHIKYVTAILKAVL